MANIFLAWQNRADEGTLSGGAWSTGLGLANLQNRQVQKVARTADTQLSSTKFTIDLANPKSIGVIALIVHNLSVLAKYRIRGSSYNSFDSLMGAFESDYSNAVWTKTLCTVSADAATAADGTSFADSITTQAGAGQSIFRDLTASGAANYKITNQWQVKASSGTTAGCALGTWWLGGTGSAQAGVYFDSSTGAITSSFTTNATINASSAVSLGNGWWLVTVTATSSITNFTSIRKQLWLPYPSTHLVYDSVLLNTDAPNYDSLWTDVWPAGVIPQDLLEWEEDNFWLGTLSQQARAGYQSPLIHKLPSAVYLRYWRIEFSDTANTDLSLQFGRLFMAQGWTPTVNYAYGASLGYQDPTVIDTSLSGAEFFNSRSKYRVMSFELQYISGTEAYNYALQLQRLAGVSGEVLVMPDGGSDLSQQPIRSFVGRLQQVGTVTQPQPNNYSVSFEVKELL